MAAMIWRCNIITSINVISNLSVCRVMLHFPTKMWHIFHVSHHHILVCASPTITVWEQINFAGTGTESPITFCVKTCYVLYLIFNYFFKESSPILWPWHNDSRHKHCKLTSVSNIVQTKAYRVQRQNNARTPHTIQRCSARTTSILATSGSSTDILQVVFGAVEAFITVCSKKETPIASATDEAAALLSVETWYQMLY